MGLRPFQIVLLGVFASLAVFALIFFMLYQGSITTEERKYGDSVEIWGTLDSTIVRAVLAEIGQDDKAFEVVKYTQKDARTFDLDFINAVAEGRSPDLIVLPSDSIVTHREKLLAISYDTLSARTFRDRYIDGAEVFLFTDGIYGIPFAVDPLMMYWNRDLFGGAGLAVPPASWSALQTTVVPALTRVNEDFSIARSAVSFGEYTNVTNAKAILSLLFLQSGSSIVSESDRRYSITLKSAEGQALSPADAALSFYTRFASPSAAEYSWSRSLSNDKLLFSSGNLGLYFGFGSEYGDIEGRNPNLNFDIAAVPQDTDATVKRDFGKVYAFAIPRASDNTSGAFAVAEVLAGSQASDLLTTGLGLAPVLRNLIAAGAADPYRQSLFSAALITRGWLDPNPRESENIFKLMIEDVTSGRSRVAESVDDAIGRLELLF